MQRRISQPFTEHFYTVTDRLGEGFYGRVLLAELALPRFGALPVLQQSAGKGGRRQPSRRLVAVKVVKPAVGIDINRATVQALLEARLLAVMRHPHLVQLLGVCMTRMPVQLVLEY